MKILAITLTFLLGSCSNLSSQAYPSIEDECNLSGSKYSKQCKILDADELTEVQREHLMGYIYYFVDAGEIQDCDKAKYWFDRAAKQGDEEALNNLGLLHFVGCGVDKNYKKAEEYFLLANEKGSKQAKANLGGLYREGGYGLKKDYDKALSWFQLAVEDEPARAYDGLALLYIDQENYEAAYEYIVQAAELGYAQSEYNLGYFYDEGIVVTQDKEKAKYWYEKSAAQGHADAQYNLNILLEVMKEEAN